MKRQLKIFIIKNMTENKGVGKEVKNPPYLFKFGEF